MFSSISPEAILQERSNETIISPETNQSSIRKAHFLNPSTVKPEFASPPLIHESFRSSFPDDIIKQVNFNGWETPPDDWKQWVRIMSMWRCHEPSWKLVGIHEAIRNSTYKIPRNEHLIFHLAERWCPDTNTFVFPWGEATITLEDMMIMGGFPVIGCSVSSVPLETRETREKKEMLDRSRLEITRSKMKKPCQKKWMEKFMCRGSEIEHEAFLAYWLSRFVFPAHAQGSIIREEVLSIAVGLARGVKVALAPAVLASIYRDLSSLKVRLVANRYSPHNVEGKELRVSAPLQIVQVWAWERFPALRPKPGSICPLEPRMAQWDGLMRTSLDYSTIFDCSGKEFLWRPYVIEGNNLSQNFYGEREEYWIALDGVFDEKVEALARCMRVAELVSLKAEYTEMYFPHRVAMQFGLDQDLPGAMELASGNPSFAWRRYTRPVRDNVFYVSARNFKAGVTERYARWWCGLNFSTRSRIKESTCNM